MNGSDHLAKLRDDEHFAQLREDSEASYAASQAADDAWRAADRVAYVDNGSGRTPDDACAKLLEAIVVRDRLRFEFYVACRAFGEAVLRRRRLEDLETQR